MGINRDREMLRDATDTERRLSNVIFLAEIAKLDAKKSLMRIKAGSIYSDWIPYMTLRAGPDRTWHIFEPGEQVLVAAPGGDINQAVILGAVYQQDFPQPEDDEDISATHWKDETFLRYDRKKHQWHLKLPHDGDAHILLEIGRTTLLLKDSETVLTTPRFYVDVEQTTTLEMIPGHAVLRADRIDLNDDR